MKKFKPIRCSDEEYSKIAAQLDAEAQEADEYLVKRAREIEAARKKAPKE